MVQLPAYAVDGGMVPAAMARRATHALSSGANGVVGIHDLKVTALPTPGAGVQISRGSALAAMRTTGAHEMETYVISQDSTFNLTVPPTGGSARTDYIIARVLDWHFTGEEPPADPTTALYWEFARVGTLNGISYPFVPLARIAIPANRSSITGAMITDFREVAMPRRKMEMGFHYPNTWVAITGSEFQTIGSISLNVPEWATHMTVKADFASMAVQGGLVQGNLALQAFNESGVQTSTYKAESNSPSSTQRYSTVVGGTWLVPAAARGGSSTLYFRANLTGSWNDGISGYDSGTTLAALIEFEERAV